ncbi:hypothetical protein POM88_038425 [Heracleum sosnowskyi]|uniref:Uncharacterized protein n=1 Tax=Heracleum sosnowskyi TaxID=360622 RepID=A0AAD8HAN1_9APIA|nr:hypothetical protein POM88_038425 [Heracleum sosnowskyi]
MENVALSPKSILLAMLMLVMIIFPKPLFCKATQLPRRELLQSGGAVCPDCLCCEDPRPSVRSSSCCACCSAPGPITSQSDKGSKETGWALAELKLPPTIGAVYHGEPVFLLKR